MFYQSVELIWLMCQGTFKYFDIKYFSFLHFGGWGRRMEMLAQSGLHSNTQLPKTTKQRNTWVPTPQIEEGHWAFVITHLLFELALCFQGRRMLGGKHIFDFNCSPTSMIIINSLQTSPWDCHGHSNFCSWNILLLWICQQGQERNVHRDFL